MKKAANIAILSLSVLLILIASSIPHHHHKNVECAIIERCISDNTCNDKHTAHQTNDDQNENSLCVKNIQSLKAKSTLYNSESSLLLLFLISTFIFAETLFKGYRHTNLLPDGYLISYKSPAGRGIQSLRAPPCFLL